ncbi:beta-lactamase/transpeptidase-like protein [Obelidium mucronatum]|nr:beta-lactamase/transpeptidase-like protein [Obelidium mucronatum]
MVIVMQYYSRTVEEFAMIDCRYVNQERYMIQSERMAVRSTIKIVGKSKHPGRLSWLGRKETMNLQLLILGLAATVLNANAADTESHGEIPWKKISNEIEAVRKEWSAPGVAVGVVQKGKLVYAKGFGTKNDAKEPVTAQTAFQIGSTTKAFTAFAAASVVDEHKLAWENNQATLVDLLSHRMGMSGHNDLAVFIHKDPTTLLSKMQYFTQSAQIRQMFGYSNMMVALAGEIAAKAAGTTLENLIRYRILNPLGMKDTFTNAHELERTKDHARGYSVDGDGITRQMNFNETYVTDGSKPAGFYCLHHRRLGQMGYSYEQPRRASPTEPNSFTLQTYGLGWFLESYRGKVRIQHSGGTPGYSCQINTYPNDDLAVIVLSNSNRNIAATVIGNLVSDRIMFPKLKYDWTADYKRVLEIQKQFQEMGNAALIASRTPNTVPSLPFAAYAGIFTNPAFGNMTLQYTDKTKNLYSASWTGDGEATLTGVFGHWDTDTFGLFEFPFMSVKNYTIPVYTATFAKDAKQLTFDFLDHDIPVVFSRV